MALAYLDPGTGAIVLQGILGLSCVVAVPALVIGLVHTSNKRGRARAEQYASQLPPPPAPSGRWYADPTGRFAQRWWAGDQWTNDVVLANGQATADPTPLPDPPPAPPLDVGSGDLG